MVLMLEKCESFALTHDILFNASNTKYMIFKRSESVNMVPLYFQNMPINCVHECDLLGITLSSSRTTDNVIEKAVMKFNMKSNEIITDFKLLPCYIKSKLFTIFVLMLTDVSYATLNQEKCIICLSLGEKLCANYGVCQILLTAISCTQLTTHSPSKYHWRKEILNILMFE